MKNENKACFTVRLNLNNPRHREAWTRLRSSPGSYTASVVDALTAPPESPAFLPDADALKDIVRQAVSEAMHDLPLAVQLGSASEETGGKVEIDDEDYDIADGFMSALGC